MDYKSSGVDIEAGNAFVESIKEKVPTIGGFNGMMRVPDNYQEPVLVSGTDGVGTKLNMARLAKKHDTIGIDLVAMCVNDVITCGADPLYFLDYIATGKLDQEILDDVLDGIIRGCDISGMQLLGGETAEMPMMYEGTKYDLAGFCTGIIEEKNIIDGRGIKPTDKVIGLASSGFHSNGYSLLNDLIRLDKLSYDDMLELLTPTTIYAPVVKKLLGEMGMVYGMAHITGGGIPENLPRCIPDGMKARVDYNSWRMPEIFSKVMLAGEIPEEEMKRVFNLGIGYCVVVPDNCVDDSMDIIKSQNIDCWTIGEIVLE
jgi:phosphoribosylformylglycinamidine cyclo-ligase